jgi:uncharacterized protein YdhG (YjbR/CyaY superfamily)
MDAMLWSNGQRTITRTLPPIVRLKFRTVKESLPMFQFAINGIISQETAENHPSTTPMKDGEELTRLATQNITTQI